MSHVEGANLRFKDPNLIRRNGRFRCTNRQTYMDVRSTTSAVLAVFLATSLSAPLSGLKAPVELRSGSQWTAVEDRGMASSISR